MSLFTTIKELQHNRLMIDRDLRKFEKELAKNHQERVQYGTMLRESEFALKELDLLKEDATVYKLVGPILVKQDSAETNGNVQKRICYLTVALKRVDANIEDLEELRMNKREKISR